MPAPFPADLPRLDEQLACLPENVDLGGLPQPKTLAACAGYLRARYELNQRYIAEIAEHTALPALCLPSLFDGVRGRADLEALADSLVPTEPEPA